GHYTFESSERASNTDPYGLLYDADQSPFAGDDDGAGNLNFRITAVLEAGQVYYLVAHDISGYGTGQYTITAQLLTPPPCSSFTSACEWDLSPVVVSPPGTAQHYLRFTSLESGLYEFSSSGAAPGADPLVMLFDADQNLITFGVGEGVGDDFSFIAELIAGEVYYVAAGQWAASNSGQYTLAARPYAPPPCSRFEEACEWDLSPVVISTTDAAQHFLRFTAPETGRYLFESSLSAQTAEPFAMLLDEDGYLITFGVGGFAGDEFTLSVLLTAGQIYYLVAGQWSMGSYGDYTISVQRFPLPPCSSFAAACEWNLSPVVVAPLGAIDHYLRFTVPESGWYVFESSERAPNADPYGLLYDADQGLIAWNDDGADDLNFRIGADLAAGEVYYLAARHYSGSGTGQFTITAQVGSPPPCYSFSAACEWDLSPLVVVPTGVSSHFVRFTAPTSGPFLFESSADEPEVDPYAWLFDADLNEIAFDDDGGWNWHFSITAELTAGQVYYLVIREWTDDTPRPVTITAQLPPPSAAQQSA
ncbi:MAG: hypothetical protein FWD59_02855, partial [Micrococcales bacterium]|nr:hypothetical protein [Micrococcales bacterium]